MRITSINQSMNTNRMNQNTSANRSNSVKSNVNFGTAMDGVIEGLNPFIGKEIPQTPTVKTLKNLLQDGSDRIVRLAYEIVGYKKDRDIYVVAPQISLIPSWKGLIQAEKERFEVLLRRSQSPKNLSNEPYGLYQLLDGIDVDVESIISDYQTQYALETAIRKIGENNLAPVMADKMSVILDKRALDATEQAVLANLRRDYVGEIIEDENKAKDKLARDVARKALVELQGGSK